MRSDSSSSFVTHLIWSHVLLILAVSPRKGADDLAIVLVQVGLAILSFLLLLRTCREVEVPRSVAKLQPQLGAALVCSTILFTIFGSTGYGDNREVLLPFRFICIPLAAVYFLPNRPSSRSILGAFYRSRRTIFWILCVAAVGLRFAATSVSPEPEIDVFWFTNQGARGLLEGINPYDRAYHVIDPRSEHLYAYLPAQFLFDVPSNILFGDMRIGQILLELLAAGLVYHIVMGRGRGDGRRHSAELASLLLLYFPQVLRMQEQSWVEFKQVCAVAAFAFLLTRTSRASGSVSAWIVFGTLLCLKQTAWAVLPFVSRVSGVTWSRIGIAAATAALIVLPFLLWSPGAFVDDVVLYHLSLPLPRSISISRAIELLTGNAPGLAMVAIGGVMVFVYLWRIQGRSIVHFLLITAALSMFPVLMRQAFLNYFYFVDGLVLVALAVVLREHHEEADGS